jgi:hypothetical protein
MLGRTLKRGTGSHNLLKTKGTRKLNINNNVFNYRYNDENYSGNVFNLPLGPEMTQANANAIFAANRDPTAKQIQKNINFLTESKARTRRYRRLP